MRTLIVDDAASFRRLLVAFLRDTPYASGGLVQASNAREALECLEREPFDLVVSDVEMPVFDGRQLLRAARATPTLVHVSVVMIGGGLSDDDMNDLLALGAAAVLRKPFTRAELIAVLERAVIARA
jgi:CheY-like chemotaxis protein